jgi:hypothetical protein
MTHQDAANLIEAVHGVKATLWWCALWLFVGAFNRDGR